jgi:hypothetical protein
MGKGDVGAGAEFVKENVLVLELEQGLVFLRLVGAVRIAGKGMGKVKEEFTEVLLNVDSIGVLVEQGNKEGWLENPCVGPMDGEAANENDSHLGSCGGFDITNNPVTRDGIVDDSGKFVGLSNLISAGEGSRGEGLLLDNRGKERSSSPLFDVLLKLILGLESFLGGYESPILSLKLVGLLPAFDVLISAIVHVIDKEVKATVGFGIRRSFGLLVFRWGDHVSFGESGRGCGRRRRLVFFVGPGVYLAHGVWEEVGKEKGERCGNVNKK